MPLVHHHLIYHASTKRRDLDHKSGKELREFLLGLVKHLKMKVLIPARVKMVSDGWTGLVGITTSHISFHHWNDEHYVQVDIYSCKKFNPKLAINYINRFWKSTRVHALFIDRKHGNDFSIRKIR